MPSNSKTPTASDFFDCTQCNQCCNGYGGTYVTDEELDAIAAFLRVTKDEMVSKYCVLSGNKPVVAQGQDGFCVFLKQNCSIHPVKPHMCRRWPFIPNVLADINNWYSMSDSCPGMKKKIDEEALLAFIKEEMSKPGY